MGKGTPKLVFRLDADTTELLRETIARRNTWTTDVEWSVSDFIRIAIREKCAKMERCRKARGKRKRSPALDRVLSI